MGIVIGILLIGIAYFLISNEAPITQGKMSYQLPYKETQSLDLYEPTQEIYSERPVLIYFHGGAWISGAKEAINNGRYHGTIKTLREKGYVIISPAYTLAEKDNSPFPACIEDALDVLKWVENQSKTYHFDLKNVGIMGESAGAHIAMMAAYANTGDFGMPYHFPLRYVVDVYGPSDLTGLYKGSPIRKTVQSGLAKLPESIQENLDIARYLFGFNPEDDSLRAQEFAQKHSPINYVNASIPPTLLIHGDVDRVVPIGQSYSLKARLDSLGITHELHVLKGMDHGFIGASSAQKDSTQIWIREFVERYYWTGE